MRRYLLDTNHLSAAIHPVSPGRDRLRQARRSGLVLGTCVAVLCELEAGIRQTNDPAGCHRALANLMGFVRVWPLETSLPGRYGEVFVELRGQGRVLSQVDMMLAALVRQMNLTLLTTDGDFSALPDLRTEDWVSAPLPGAPVLP